MSPQLTPRSLPPIEDSADQKISVGGTMHSLADSSLRAVSSAADSGKRAINGAVDLGKTASVHGLRLVENQPIPDRKKLTEVEFRRKELLKRGTRSQLVVLCSWRGTVLRWSLRSPVCWLTILTYAICRILIRMNTVSLDQLPEVSTAQVGVLSGFLNFFLVFYVGHGYSRFNTQYGSSMSMEGRIFDTCAMAAAAMPRASAHRLMRHINGAHVLGYVGLSDTYNVNNFLRHFQRANQLFTVAEWARIRAIGADGGGAACREAIVWAIQDIQAEAKAGNIGSSLELALMEQVCRLRGSIGTLYDYNYQPIPVRSSSTAMLHTALTHRSAFPELCMRVWAVLLCALHLAYVIDLPPSGGVCHRAERVRFSRRSL